MFTLCLTLFSAKLTELRNSTLMAVYVVNALWIILIITLVNRSELNVIGTNALGQSYLHFGRYSCIQ